ncbi:MAG TPA: type II toxin-antitoxin system RelE/ParE family toxin [Acidobacteriota bacterium]|jgi:plasmid stabilization system protein ParE
MDSRQRQVIWSREARSALDEVLSYISQNSPIAAEQFLDQTLATAATLASFSERGRVVPEIGNSDTRELFIQRYRLIYEVTSTEVRILAFVHGARDFAKWRQGE